MSYTPELGQAAFGQPWQEHEVPEIMTAALDAIGNEIERIVGNVIQERISSPRHNGATAFRCAAFGMWAYSWGDDEQPYNFFHPESGVKISWYKYGGRGESANVAITPDMAALILDDCLRACRACDGPDCDGDPDHPFQSGGLGDVPYFAAPSPQQGAGR